MKSLTSEVLTEYRPTGPEKKRFHILLTLIYTFYRFFFGGGVMQWVSAHRLFAESGIFKSCIDCFFSSQCLYLLHGVSILHFLVDMLSLPRRSKDQSRKKECDYLGLGFNCATILHGSHIADLSSH